MSSPLRRLKPLASPYSLGITQAVLDVAVWRAINLCLRILVTIL
jgi:hypothetical protein